MLGGAAIGMGALVALPVAGFKKANVLGGVAGVVGGVGMLTLGVAGGAVAGVASLLVGAAKTPGTVAAIVSDDDLHGKEKIDLSQVDAAATEEYDKSRASVDKALDEEAPEYTPTATPKESELYIALGVAPDSTPGQIKKAYYKLAMKEHPDKGGDKEKFQAIGDAYQVLSDPEKRKKYDEKGMAGLEDQQLADPGIVFAMMFGEAQFGHLVGDLAVVSAQRVEAEGLEGKAKADKLKELQKAREARLAKLLAVRLDGWVTGDKHKFITEALHEAAKLTELHMGPQMLLSIGIEYELAADRSLGVKGHDWFGFSAQQHQASTGAKAIGAAFKMGHLQQDFDKLTDEEKAKTQEKFAEDIQASMYNLMALDIESTVAAAVSLCCADTSVTKEVRRERAHGILKLGKIFQGKLPDGPVSLYADGA